MFDTILLCSDGSPEAQQTARITAAIASRLKSCVLLLHVFDTSDFAPSYLGGWAPGTAGYERYVQLGHQVAEEAVVPILEKACVRSQPIRVAGHPVDQIVQVAQEQEADLIALGGRGLGGWKAVFMGGVSSGVLHHAPCPVLIVRGNVSTFGRILVGSDGSDAALRATAAAVELACKFGSDLTVLSVCETRVPLAEDVDELGSTARDRIRESLTQCAGKTVSPVNMRQEAGRPVDVLTRVAETEHYDLIVLGSRGLGTVKSLLLGSVSESVAQRAYCPVLIVR